MTAYIALPAALLALALGTALVVRHRARQAQAARRARWEGWYQG